MPIVASFYAATVGGLVTFSLLLLLASAPATSGASSHVVLGGGEISPKSILGSIALVPLPFVLLSCICCSGGFLFLVASKIDGCGRFQRNSDFLGTLSLGFLCLRDSVMEVR